MDDRTPTRFFVLIKFGGDTAIRTRVVNSVPRVKDIIEKVSRGEYQLAFTSDDGGCFGFVLMSKLKAHQIRTQLESPDPTRTSMGSPLIREDSLLVLEIGDDFTGYGFSRAWTWLQHHQ